MPKPIRIFVGTDQRMQQHGAERVLEYSIKKHCSLPYEITYMRAGDSSWTVGTENCDWSIGRPPWKPYSGKGWATDFTCFRFCVPELADYSGRAIYMDADMIFLKDPTILWTTKTRKPWDCAGPRTDVSIIDCSSFRSKVWWPSISEMKPSGWYIKHYVAILRAHGYIGHSINPQWNNLDGQNYSPQETNLIHYTNMRTQPWFPYPDVFDYSHPHRDKWVCDIYYQYEREAKESHPSKVQSK